MKKLFLCAAVLCSIFTSCSKEEPPVEPTPVPTPEEQVKIPINLSIGNYTKANDTSFENDDKVGIYVVNYSGSTAGILATTGNHVTNMQFKYSGSAWTPSSQIYWADNTTHADFYAYYPYSATPNVAAHPFEVKTDQSAEANYWASDFLWGKATDKAPSNSPVAITTNHVFSNILVYLEAGDGFTAAEFSSATKTVKINGVKTSATINLATGVATATGTATSVTPWNVGEYFRAMVVPQSVSQGVELLTVTINGVEYGVTLATDATFEANEQHKVTAKINKYSNGVNIGIGGWGTGGSDYSGDAE